MIEKLLKHSEQVNRIKFAFWKDFSGDILDSKRMHGDKGGTVKNKNNYYNRTVRPAQ